MNNILVYCEVEGTRVLPVSQELLTKGRTLANELGVELHAVAIGTSIKTKIEQDISVYGVDKLFVFDGEGLYPYTSAPHREILVKLCKEEQPQIFLLGATLLGRDLGPQVSSALNSGLTADCTELSLGSYKDEATGVTCENILQQMGPAFGGNIMANIISPHHRPQMATVREGVMKREKLSDGYPCAVVYPEVSAYVGAEHFAVQVIDRHIEPPKHNLQGASVVVAGGYGVGSKKNFDLLFDLAKLLHGEVGATRPAVDAGWTDYERQIGHTGVTVRPKLFIGVGISGQIQHVAGMQESAVIVSINNDPDAPFNKMADYVIVGDAEEVVKEMIKSMMAAV